MTATPHAVYSLNAGAAATAGNALQLNGQPPAYYQNAANLTGTLPAASLGGTYSGVLNLSNAGNTFAGSGAGLTLLNASNISTGVLDAARMPSDWGASGDLTGFYPGPSIADGVVTRSKLSADVQSVLGSPGHLIPALAGSAATGSFPSTVEVAGSFAYVANGIGTVQIFDVSNPASPTLAGSVSTGASTFSVAVSGSHAYIAVRDAGTLRVYDVSNPAAPTLTGSVSTQAFPLAIAVSGSYAYVVGFSGSLQVFDISNPAAPVLAGSLTTGGILDFVAVSGPYAYVLGDFSAIRVFDVSNPAAPALAGNVATAGNPHVLTVSGSYLYLAPDTNSLQVFDLANPAAPVLAGSAATAGTPLSIAVSGPNAIVTEASNTLQVFDVSNPAAPVLVSGVATGNAPVAVAVFGSHAFVACRLSHILQVFALDRVTSHHAPQQFRTSVFIGDAVPAPGPGLAVGGTGVFTGAVTASSFTGTGGGLTGLNASNMTSGTLSTARLPVPIDLSGAGNWIIRAVNASASTDTPAILGQSTAGSGGTVGVWGESASSAGRGVFGSTTAASSGTIGVLGQAASTQGLGVYGLATATTGSTTGVQGQSASTTGIGVFAVATAPSGFTQGVRAESRSTGGTAVTGWANATTGTTYGVYGQSDSPSGWGVLAGGRLGATGAKSFRIDHPEDPENKYLLHYSTESPEVLNAYRGTVILDGAGGAVVELPPYFASINKSPSYTLTAVGAPMPLLHIAEEISDEALRAGEQAGPGDAVDLCTFRIAGGVPGGKVSWRIEAVRNDQWMRHRAAPVEADKEGHERGTYQHPEFYGQPPEKGAGYESRRPRQEGAAGIRE